MSNPFGVQPSTEDLMEALRASMFLDNGPGKAKSFSAAKMGAVLTNQNPAARDAWGNLYAYHDNRWQPDGEWFYRSQVREFMAERWRSAQSAEVVTWITDGAALLDEQPDLNLIRVLNGVIDISSGTPVLNDHSVYPLTPVYLPVHFDPDAQRPLFDKFMSSTLPVDLAAIAQEALGYLLVPDNSQQKAFMFWGEGGNGKSTWVNIATALLGDENSTAYGLNQLGPDFRFNVANLYGKLANLAADISSAELSSSEIFRQITGGDRIQGEHKGKRSFKFLPYVRMLFSANKYPAIANPTNALFDRWIVVPFEGRFRGQEGEIKDLDKKVSATELPGVLNWALEGLLRLRRQGSFSRSEASEVALDVFRLEADTVASFLRDEEIGYKAGAFVKASLVLESYKLWCAETGHKPLTRNNFYSRVDQIWGKRHKRSDIGWTVR